VDIEPCKFNMALLTPISQGVSISSSLGALRRHPCLRRPKACLHLVIYLFDLASTVSCLKYA
ncbi:hypothetical protein, partial [Shewanella insulae]|uniref:hypothetical protein n=1 Tax=Shewanella insulae TaxID=2681496 RepID=UPI00247FDE7F